MEIGNYSQHGSWVLEPAAYLNMCKEYLQLVQDTYNTTATLPTLEVPPITGTTLVVAGSCLAICLLILTLKLGLACMRRQPSPPTTSGSLISGLLMPVAAVGATSLLLCTQFFMGVTGRQLYIPATFLWTWCRHTFFFLITSANLFHIQTLKQPLNQSSTPPATILTRLTTLLTAFMLLVLGAALSTPSAMRALHTPPCGWAAVVESYSDFGNSAEVWVIWLDSVASVLSIFSAFIMVKKAIGVHNESSLEAAEHERKLLRWLVIEGVSTGILTASLGLPATLIALYVPLNSTSSKINFPWMMALEEILQTVYYAAIASVTFMSQCLAQDKHWLCHCFWVEEWRGVCLYWQPPRVEPEEPMPEVPSTHHVTTLVAEYVANVEAEDEGVNPIKRKDTCITLGGESESLFSVNMNMPQSAVKENFRRKTFFDRPSVVSRAANPTPHHGRPFVSLAGHSIKSIISSSDTTQPHASRHNSILSQLSIYDLTNISLYSDASIPNQETYGIT